MKILSAQQIREWDAFTIKEEPISSLNLMERAVSNLLPYLLEIIHSSNRVHVFCGKGNNGGDGLVLARLLFFRKVDVKVYIFTPSENVSSDFQINLDRLKQLAIPISIIQDEHNLSEIYKEDCIIDALLGSGLNKPLSGVLKNLVGDLNQHKAKKVSIDIPTGLRADPILEDDAIIFKADFTFTFQVPKLSMLLPDGGKYVGQLKVLNIGLHPAYPATISHAYHYVSREEIKYRIQSRPVFGHKGTFGHALLVVGAKGTFGAGVLSCKACMRSGVGKLTSLVPPESLSLYHISCPEVMFDSPEIVEESMNIDAFNAVGVGPGIGKSQGALDLFVALLQKTRKSIVIDADALNLLAENPELLKFLPPKSILTPHLKEFERLVGEPSSDLDRIEKAKSFAASHKIILVLKGAHTFITDGTEGYFNGSGNSGMATAGSGDVLTGIITGLLAQGYASMDAALIAVFLHGMAGDLSLTSQSRASLIASDIIENLGLAFKEMS